MFASIEFAPTPKRYPVAFVPGAMVMEETALVEVVPAGVPDVVPVAALPDEAVRVIEYVPGRISGQAATRRSAGI